MRTLVVVRSLKMGGMERVAVNLADAFAEVGHESHLLTFRKACRPLSPSRSDVKVHHFSLHWAMRLSLVGAVAEALSRWFLNPLIRRSYFVCPGFLGGYLFRAWLWWFERRHGRVDRIIFRGVGTFEQVWSYRDPRARFVLENLVYRRMTNWRRRLFARCLFQGKHLVAVSRGVAKNVEDAQRALGFTPASLSVIVNPCPLASIRHLMQEPVPEIPDQPYIVNVARLVPAKDQALLLRAYAIAAPEELLVLVGAGQERKRLEALAEELGIRDRVIFAGQQANPYPWMRHARLFVLSSRFEGMGIVLFEALACGTPVLSVNCPGGVREILKGPLESALVPHDAESLAEGIRAVLRGEKPLINDACLEDFQPQTVVARFLEGVSSRPSSQV